MKIKENITVFVCDHCGKKMFRRHAMEKHEIYCGQNPENDRACSYCDYMERREIKYYYDGYDGEHSGKSNGFYCIKIEKYIYPPFIEGSPVFYNHPEQFEDQIPFKKECENLTVCGMKYGKGWEKDW